MPDFLLASEGEQLAYQISGNDWTWQPTPIDDPFELNPSTFPASAGTVPNIEAAWVGALDEWTITGGSPIFSFTYGGQTTNTSWSNDGRMIGQWYTTSPGGGAFWA